ncbi:hypothetical protein [Streptomyces lanatus]|uniref:Uncharacterized protein n=1 Tax=Streptomyces lanatus TaxID=66900 RepID=A0ABV1XJ37_9ACTN|nr:hypothetical protein [Streptomyces lanatus]GHG91722.1 hypothetical protein GCM10018780_12550 [Streptomyces lanatus]
MKGLLAWLWKRFSVRASEAQEPIATPPPVPRPPGSGAGQDNGQPRPPTKGTPPPPPAPRSPSVDLRVVEAVLDVSLRLSSAELRRLLTEAVGLLPGAQVIAPARGVRFDPALHKWARSVPAATPDDVETVAETIHAGFADQHGAIQRRALVTVFDRTEDET